MGICLHTSDIPVNDGRGGLKIALGGRPGGCFEEGKLGIPVIRIQDSRRPGKGGTGKE